MVQHQYWTLTETPLGYPSVAESHGYSAALVLQDQLIYIFQQVIDGVDACMDQLKVLDVDLGSNLVGQSGPLLGLPSSREGRTNFPVSTPSGSALQHPW